ncbi:Hypothetical predicted protein [Lecanosticta acicola]|uniref:J domain-containing protein n=1 Tax=Lecanosticta acicola TaxID=111012 RepID=A0AAI8Z6W8_9PEZI|nr:Hypothetical predicted protein [Lecanosticta acicola]
MSAAGLDMNALRQMIKLDVAACNELQTKIHQYRWEILGGKRPNDKELDLMEASNKDMTKDLVQRIERIEGQGHKTSSDREMLQALNARLAVCDHQQMRLTELRDLDRETNGGKCPERATKFAEDNLPLGGRLRRPSNSPQSRVTEHLRLSSEADARSTSPGPIFERADSKAASPAGSRDRGTMDEYPCRASQLSGSPRTPASPSMAFGTPPGQPQPPSRGVGITRAATDTLTGPPRRPSPQAPPISPATTFGTPYRPSQTPPQATVTARAARDGSGEDMSARRHSLFSPPPPPPLPVETPHAQSRAAATPSAHSAIPNRMFRDSTDDVPGRRHSTMTPPSSAPPPPAQPVELVNMPRKSNESPRPMFSNVNWSRTDNVSATSAQANQPRDPPLQNYADTARTSGTPIEYPAAPPSLTSSRPAERFYDKYVKSAPQHIPRASGDPRASSENVTQVPHRRPSQLSQMTPKYLDTPKGANNVSRPSPPEPITERQSTPYKPPMSGSSRTSSEYSLPPSRPRSATKRSYEAPYVRDALDDDTELEPDRSGWPLLYRILDVDPATDSSVFDATARRALTRMSLKHDPTKVPGDPEAPVRWAAVLQAFDTLIDPERKRAYDIHSAELVDCDDSDFAKLSMNPASRR